MAVETGPLYFHVSLDQKVLPALNLANNDILPRRSLPDQSFAQLFEFLIFSFRWKFF